MSEHFPEWRSPPWIPLTARLAVFIWRWNNDREGQRPMLGRLTAHTAIILILSVFLLLGILELDTLASINRMVDRALLEGLAQNVDAAASEQSVLAARPYNRLASQSRIVRHAEVHTAIPDRPRLEIVTHTVQPGETAENIAALYDLQPTTLMWSNPEMEKMPDMLQVGQTLTILPLDGVYHTVEISDTLESIAEQYDVQATAIAECAFNELPEEGALPAGLKVIVPGGTKPYETRQVTAYAGPIQENVQSRGWFLWPTYGAVLSQGYWYGHRAIDLCAPVGTAIVAADGGFISFAGWTDVGYGYLVVVDHQNGYQTYYAHLSEILVMEGQVVSAGDVIGKMGSTGNSTGPHLHFEVRYNSLLLNPLTLLQ